MLERNKHTKVIIIKVRNQTATVKAGTVSP